MSTRKGKNSKNSSGRKENKHKNLHPHQVWEFRPKLQNQAVVLNSTLDLYTIDYYEVMVDDVRNLITQLIRNHGFNDGSKRYKVISNFTFALIEGREPENPGWLATSEVYRAPSQLGKNFTQLIADYFQVDDPDIQARYYQVINTTLNIVRMVEGLTDDDILSITEKSTTIDQDLLEGFDNFVCQNLEKFKYGEYIPNLFDIRFNIKKNGPNGIPKVESAIKEAIFLKDSRLFNPFRIVCEELNAPYLVSYISLLYDKFSETEDEYASETTANRNRIKREETHLRVLASVPDKGFKTRLVAIVDFWTQLILEPFRSHVQFVVKSKFNKFDFRLDQDLGVAKMVEFQQRCLDCEVIEYKGNLVTLDAKHLKFYDITSWTDRFHRDLQKIVVKNLFTPRFAEAWAQLVVHCPWYHPKSRRILKYGQGQGMGTNGSFDIATLSDHLLIKYVDSNDYDGLIHHIGGYGKVGDDLWIYDPENKIPEIYEKINLPINFTKSKSFCEIGSVAEFCSRTFLNTTDVSRISPNIISKSKNFHYIPILLGLCSSRGIQLNASSFQTLSNITREDGVSYLDKLQEWLASYLVLAQVEHGSMWDSLSVDYLSAGGWLKSDIVKNVIDDAKLNCRLRIGYSLVTILENKEVLQDKLFETVDAMDDYGDEVIQLCDPGVNLFDPGNPMYGFSCELVNDDILTPKQIVVFGRYKDQRSAIHDQLIELTEELASAEDPEDIYTYSLELAKLASKSCYDEGNLNYEHDLIVGQQFKIVKVLRRMSEDFQILYDVSAAQLRSLLQDLEYDEIAERWEGYMPELQTCPKPPSEEVE